MVSTTVKDWLASERFQERNALHTSSSSKILGNMAYIIGYLCLIWNRMAYSDFPCNHSTELAVIYLNDGDRKQAWNRN